MLCNLIDVYIGKALGRELNNEDINLLYNLLMDKKSSFHKRNEYFQNGALFMQGANSSSTATSVVGERKGESNNNNYIHSPSNNNLSSNRRQSRDGWLGELALSTMNLLLSNTYEDMQLMIQFRFSASRE